MAENNDDHAKVENNDESGPELTSHFNKFQLLDPEDDVDDRDSSEDASQSEQENSEEVTDSKPSYRDGKHNNISTKSRSKKRKAKKKANQNTKENQNIKVDGNLVAKDNSSQCPESSLNSTNTQDCASLLRLDLRNLNIETELKKMFGKCVLKEEKLRDGFGKVRLGTSSQRSRFVPSFNFDMIKSQNSPYPRMTLDDVFNDKGHVCEKTNFYQTDITYFRYTHDQSYQRIQSEFMVAINQGASEAIVQNYTLNPTHVESLVKLSDLMRMSENYKDASQCIERALLILERGFHPKFNPMTGHCRLTYRRPENRTLYITLFKHISCLNRRGLRRTPLEYTKFLLSLDPVTDPLFAVSLIDFLAIRAEEYDYYIDFVSKWKHSSRLPSFNLSLALAYFLKSRNPRFNNKKSSDELLKKADETLQLSLLRYPNFIANLLDACSAEPQGNLKKCDYFNYTIFGNRYKTVPETVELLMNLYVQRTCPLWKAKHVMAWLEKNVEIMVDKFANKQLIDEQINLDYWSHFKGAEPRNLLRHVILSELEVKLPQSVSNSTTLDIDPFPPSNTINSYELKTSSTSRNPTNSSSSSTSLGIAGLFLRSIMPSFSQSADENFDQVAAQEQLAEIQANIGPGDHNLNEIFDSMINYMRTRRTDENDSNVNSNQQAGSNNNNQSNQNNPQDHPHND